MPWKARNPVDMRMEMMVRLGQGEKLTDLYREYKTPPELVEVLVAERRLHPTWGPRKIKEVLEKRLGHPFPAPSTIGDVFAEQGLIVSRRKRRRHFPLPTARREATAPNKHSDNGVPFACTGLAGLTKLSAYWLRLGITLERSRPAHPQDNGRHERMHRTLKAETTRPARDNLLQQQERFDQFVEEFNTQRPHEALDISALPRSTRIRLAAGVGTREQQARAAVSL